MLKGNGNMTELTLYHLKTIYQYLLGLFVVAQALRDFKTSTIFVYMIPNRKWILTGCGLRGYTLISFFLTGQSN